MKRGAREIDRPRRGLLDECPSLDKCPWRAREPRRPWVAVALDRETLTIRDQTSDPAPRGGWPRPGAWRPEVWIPAAYGVVAAGRIAMSDALLAGAARSVREQAVWS